MKHKIKLGLYTVITAAIMAVIFFFSSQNAEVSKGVSDGLAARIISMVVTRLPSLARQLKDGETIRTFAHFSEYTCLGISAMLLFNELFASTERTLGFTMPVTVVFGFLYAVSDEIHQIFVPGRAFQIEDIAVDTLGCIIGTLFTVLIIKLLCKTGASFNEQ